mmetsp:Transcript_114177/g.354435  ORF Transcript_114177/g.354435 Transcript_114177/m.354435 type:complete len:263 (-) Transcript_114177:86-874(-)
MSPAPHLVSLVLLAVAGQVQARCARNLEDCTHSGCCEVPGHSCFKKDYKYCGCMKHCTPGNSTTGPPMFQGMWECTLVDPDHPACASQHEDCLHMGCCKNPKHKCFKKNPGQAFCLEACPQNQGWLCREVTVHKSVADASHGGHGWDDQKGPAWDEEGGHGWDWNATHNGDGHQNRSGAKALLSRAAMATAAATAARRLRGPPVALPLLGLASLGLLAMLGRASVARLRRGRGAHLGEQEEALTVHERSGIESEGEAAGASS